MADEDKDSKTEEPSDRKLEKAAEEGNRPQSQEIKAIAGLLSALILVSFAGPWMMGVITPLLVPFLSHAHEIPVDLNGARWMLAETFGMVGVYMAAPLGVFMLLALTANIMQVGLKWTPKKLMPDFKKFSPLQGAKKLFSSRSLVEFFKSIIKLAVVSVVLYAVVMPNAEIVTVFPSLSIPAMLSKLRDVTLVLLIVVTVMMVLIAALDYLYQRWKYMQDQRMTKQEVKDETKSSQGDPLVKQRIARIRNERARKRMMAAVPTADVVVTNPTHFAIAPEYKHELMAAPRLVAKGVDSLAMKIREIAEEHDVPIVENPPLARALYASVELDEEIPPEHYKAVAEVIGYVMRLKGKLPQAPRPL